MSTMIRMLKLVGISVGVVAAVLAGTIGTERIGSSVRERRDEALAAFKPHLDSYTGEFEKSLSELPYIHGKLVLVAVASNDNTGALTSDRHRSTPYIDHLTLRLPDRLQAKDPSEVGTVVWLRWGQKYIGNYGKTARGYKEMCAISIIDVETRQVVGTREFEGGDPPRSVSEHTRGSVFGSDADSEILAYLGSLPQK